MVLALSKDNAHMIGIDEAISIDNKEVMQIKTNVEEEAFSISNEAFETKVKKKVVK